MRVDGAQMLIDGLLLITTDNAARRFVYDFKPGEYEISKATKKRSLNAANDKDRRRSEDKQRGRISGYAQELRTGRRNKRSREVC